MLVEGEAALPVGEAASPALPLECLAAYTHSNILKQNLESSCCAANSQYLAYCIRACATEMLCCIWDARNSLHADIAQSIYRLHQQQCQIFHVSAPLAQGKDRQDQGMLHRPSKANVSPAKQQAQGACHMSIAHRPSTLTGSCARLLLHLLRMRREGTLRSQVRQRPMQISARCTILAVSQCGRAVLAGLATPLAGDRRLLAAVALAVPVAEAELLLWRDGGAVGGCLAGFRVRVLGGIRRGAGQLHVHEQNLAPGTLFASLMIAQLEVCKPLAGV